jgi:hypothetical protein
MFNTNTLDQVEYVTTVVDAVRAQNQGTFHRQTIKTANTITDLDVTRTDLRRPELTTFDDTNYAGHRIFRKAVAPWALKVKSSDAPDPENHKDIIDQVADVVRLRMAIPSRPFQLFILSLMLCDSRFWVSTWDRDGVVVSRPHHLEEEQDLFRRIIISLHCNLDLYDLGLDRNVSIASEPNIHANIEKALVGNPKTQPTTTALIDSGAAVNNLDNAKVDVQSPHSGLPIYNLVPTSILLAWVGKPIWEYEDDTEIMRGARDMLQGPSYSLAVVIIIGADLMTSSSRLSP